MTKLAPEWVQTSDPVIRSPARYRWATAPAEHEQEQTYIQNYIYIDITLYIQRNLTVKLLPCSI